MQWNALLTSMFAFIEASLLFFLKHCIKDFTGQVPENISELQTLYRPKMLLQSSGKHLVAAPETRSKLLIWFIFLLCIGLSQLHYESHSYLQGLLLDLLLLHTCENHLYVIIALNVASSISYFATLVDFKWFPISLLYSLYCCNNLRIKEVLSF